MHHFLTEQGLAVARVEAPFDAPAGRGKLIVVAVVLVAAVLAAVATTALLALL